MTGDPALLEPARRAVARIAAADPTQIANVDGLMRVALCAQALHSAHAANLTVDAVASAWLSAWPDPTMDPPWSSGEEAGDATAALCAASAAIIWSRTTPTPAADPRIERIFARIDELQPQALALSPLIADLGTFAIVCSDVTRRNRWKPQYEQVTDACLLGDPATDGTWDTPGSVGDRVAATALRLKMLAYGLTNR